VALVGEVMAGLAGRGAGAEGGGVTHTAVMVYSQTNSATVAHTEDPRNIVRTSGSWPSESSPEKLKLFLLH
jgi:hypothetical protein